MRRHRTAGDPPQQWAFSLHPGCLPGVLYCSGEFGGESGGKKQQGGVELAVRIYITRAACPPEFLNDYLLKFTLELRGRTKSVTFIVEHAPNKNRILVINMRSRQACTELRRKYVTRTVTRVDGCQRPHGEEGQGRHEEQG